MSSPLVKTKSVLVSPADEMLKGLSTPLPPKTVTLCRV